MTDYASASIKVQTPAGPDKVELRLRHIDAQLAYTEHHPDGEDRSVVTDGSNFFRILDTPENGVRRPKMFEDIVASAKFIVDGSVHTISEWNTRVTRSYNHAYVVLDGGQIGYRLDGELRYLVEMSSANGRRAGRVTVSDTSRPTTAEFSARDRDAAIAYGAELAVSAGSAHADKAIQIIDQDAPTLTVHDAAPHTTYTDPWPGLLRRRYVAAAEHLIGVIQSHRDDTEALARLEGARVKLNVYLANTTR